MATTIKLKNGSGAPTTGDLVQGEPAFDLTNKRLYTEDSGGTVIEVGTNPTSLTTGTFTSTGIDDNATSTKLTVADSAITTGSIDQLIVAHSTDGGGVRIDSTNSTNTGSLRFGDDLDNYIGALEYNHTSNAMSMYVNNATRMTIDSSGNVGIGTASPASLIHGMSGDLFLTANSAAADSGQGIYFQSTTSGWSTSGAHSAIFGKRVDASNGYLRFDTRSGGTTAERMRIDSSGNVLVGTTAGMTQGGGGPLQVYSSAGSQVILGKSTGAPSISFGSTTTQYGLIEGINGGGFNFYTGNGTVSNRLVIDASGNLGLNTTSPSSYGGGFVVDDLGINIVTASSSSPGTNKLSWWSDSNGISQNAYISVVNDGATTNTGEMVFYTKNASATLAERMRLDSAGNVGIGTTSPTSSSGWAKFINIGGTDTNALILDGTESQQAAVGAVDGLYIDCVGSSTASKNKIIFRTQSANSNYNGAERMRIDSNGQIMISGSTTAFDTTGAVNGLQAYYETDTGLATLGSYSSGGSTSMTFHTNSGGANSAERMRIDSSGDVQIHGTSMLASSILSVDGSGEARNGVASKVSNNAYYAYVGINSNGDNRFVVYGDGDVENTNNSYGALSDERLKSNIVDASSQVDDIMAVQVRSYTLNETGDTHIGVVAQELEASGMSGLVKTKDDGMKSVKYSILYMKAIKALQEAVTRIETLEAEVAALKGE